MSEALRLADLLERDPREWGGLSLGWKAAAELRRLAAVEQELEALKQASVVQQEPAFYVSEYELGQFKSVSDFMAATLRKHPGDGRVPVYTHPAQQAKPAKPQPLSDEQIEKGRQATFSTNNPFCPCDSKTMRKAVRWTEAAHGIFAEPAQAIKE